MKVSLNWLKELVDVPVSVEELSNLFNLHSAEVDEFYKLVEASNVVVGHVLEVQKHPDADKLNVCKVDIGGEVSQIVCGAPNVATGQHVIVSLPGATLPGGFVIKKSTIRGVESNGMICSLSELGIDKKFHNEEGIHEIQVACKAGDNPLDVLAFNDDVFSLDLTPNRADLLSVLGVAYDTAAILNKKVKPRAIKVKEISKKNPVKITLDTPNCSSYYARVIEQIEIKPSPRFIQTRLIASGIRPINNVVDITNYVMLETGQPLHAFDFDLLEGNDIVVRMARENEELVTLDGKERCLTKEDIVITDGTKSIALGGVMGGYDTEINANSKTILLESAVFDPFSIRKTSNRLDLRSEASTRFERSVDPNRTLLALEMATDLFVKYASGQSLNGISVVENNNLDEVSIPISVSTINRVLGTTYSLKQVQETFDRLTFTYTVINNDFLVSVPTRRQDIKTYQDLIEEVGRIMGYDQLPTTIPYSSSQGKLSDFQIYKRQIKTILNGLGLDELITYSLISKDVQFDFVSSNENLSSETVNLLMPMSQDKSTLTLSPLNGIIDVIQYNVARKNPNQFVFEFGKRYTKNNEELRIAGAMTGLLSNVLWQGKKEVVDFYTLKGVLQSLFDEIGLGHLEFVPTDEYKNLHPGQQALIVDRSGVIGFVGKCHPKYEKDHDLKDVYVFELQVEKLYSLRRTFKKVKDINKFPSVERDIAVVVDKTVTAKQLRDTITKAGKRMLVNVSVFDQFTGGNLDESQKSIAMRLEFQDPKRTLETKEVDERVAEILQSLKKILNAELR